VTSSWFFLSTLNYDARSTTYQIYIEVFYIKLILFVVPCVSEFIEFYYLFLFTDFKGVNNLC